MKIKKLVLITLPLLLLNAVVVGMSKQIQYQDFTNALNILRGRQDEATIGTTIAAFKGLNPNNQKRANADALKRIGKTITVLIAEQAQTNAPKASSSDATSEAKRVANKKAAVDAKAKADAAQQAALVALANAQAAAATKAKADAAAKVAAAAQAKADADALARANAENEAKARAAAEEKARTEAAAQAAADAKLQADKDAQAAAEAKAKADAEQAAADAKAKLDAEQAEKDRLAAEAKAKADAEQAEKDRLAAEAKAKADAERAAKDKAAQEAQAEKDRLAAEAKAKADAEQAAKDKAAQEAQTEKDRLAAEAKAKADAEQAEKDRLATEQAAKEKAEQEAKDKAAAQKARLEKLKADVKNLQNPADFVPFIKDFVKDQGNELSTSNVIYTLGNRISELKTHADYNRVAEIFNQAIDALKSVYDISKIKKLPIVPAPAAVVLLNEAEILPFLKDKANFDSELKARENLSRVHASIEGLKLVGPVDVGLIATYNLRLDFYADTKKYTNLPAQIN